MARPTATAGASPSTASSRDDAGRAPPGVTGLLGKAGISSDVFWGVVFVLPYLAIFVFFVVYPIGYGLWLGSDPAAYRALFNDPVYYRTVINTLLLLVVGVNVKMFLALMISGFFLLPYRWVPILFLVFILPWAMPAIPTFISAHWLLNGQWGLINAAIWRWFEVDGPGWLTDPTLAMGSIIVFYIWKWLPFWTVIFVAGRTAIPTELYEAARIDGAQGTQLFRYVTFPLLRSLYLICTVLSTIWSLGDYNTVRFITGGGPVLSTHVLATLGVRDAFELGQPQLGMAAVISALPLLIPLVVFLMRKLSRDKVQL